MIGVRSESHGRPFGDTVREPLNIPLIRLLYEGQGL